MLQYDILALSGDKMNYTILISHVFLHYLRKCNDIDCTKGYLRNHRNIFSQQGYKITQITHILLRIIKVTFPFNILISVNCYLFLSFHAQYIKIYIIIRFV